MKGNDKSYSETTDYCIPLPNNTVHRQIIDTFISDNGKQMLLGIAIRWIHGYSAFYLLDGVSDPNKNKKVTTNFLFLPAFIMLHNSRR